jgi:hypothetical protein
MSQKFHLGLDLLRNKAITTQQSCQQADSEQKDLLIAAKGKDSKKCVPYVAGAFAPSQATDKRVRGGHLSWCRPSWNLIPKGDRGIDMYVSYLVKSICITS